MLLINFNKPSLQSFLTKSGYQSVFLCEQFRFDLSLSVDCLDCLDCYVWIEVKIFF